MKKYTFPLLLLIHAGFALAQNPAQGANLHVLAGRIDADEKRLADWPEFTRYRDDNARLAAPAPGEARVVFFGDSITDGWGRGAGEFFPGKPYVNRGISGQTTPQMLVRFRADVIALKPSAVVIRAGNTGPSSLEMIEDNLASMAELARANGIKVVLASVLPAREKLVYLDYYAAMADGQGGLRGALSGDGVHPNTAGYAVMAPLAQRAIEQALAH